jgi:hypothetical protein
MGVLDEIQLRDGERAIDRWGILYHAPGGGKYNGKLLVTSQRLCYDPQLDYSSLSTVLAGEYLVKAEKGGHVEIPKDRIRNVEVKKSLFAKRAILTLDDGSVHSFDRGMMSIDAVAAAIQQR